MPPADRCDMRAFYPVLTPMGLSAVAGYTTKNGLIGTRLDPFRRHDRWRGALSRAPPGGVRRCPASHLDVSYRGRGEQGCRRGCRQRPSGPGSPTPPTTQRAPEYTSSHAGGPHEKAAGSATRRGVGRTSSVRPASPQPNRTENPGARQPGVPPAPGAAGDHGAGVRGMRAALSDPDRPEQTGEVALACPAVHLPR